MSSTVKIRTNNPALFGVAHLADNVLVTHDDAGLAEVPAVIGAHLCDFPADPDTLVKPFEPASEEDAAVIDACRRQAVQEERAEHYLDTGDPVMLRVPELAGLRVIVTEGIPVQFDEHGQAVVGELLAQAAKAAHPATAEITPLSDGEKSSHARRVAVSGGAKNLDAPVPPTAPVETSRQAQVRRAKEAREARAAAAANPPADESPAAPDADTDSE